MNKWQVLTNKKTVGLSDGFRYFFILKMKNE